MCGAAKDVLGRIEPLVVANRQWWRKDAHGCSSWLENIMFTVRHHARGRFTVETAPPSDTDGTCRTGSPAHAEEDQPEDKGCPEGRRRRQGPDEPPRRHEGNSSGKKRSSYSSRSQIVVVSSG